MPFKQINTTFAGLRKGDAYSFGHSPGLEPSVSFTTDGLPSFGIFSEEYTYFSNWDGPELIAEWEKRAADRDGDADGVTIDTEICIIRFEQETH